MQKSESIITVSPLDTENSDITPHQGSEQEKREKNEKKDYAAVMIPYQLLVLKQKHKNNIILISVSNQQTN